MVRVWSRTRARAARTVGWRSTSRRRRWCGPMSCGTRGSASSRRSQFSTTTSRRSTSCAARSPTRGAARTPRASIRQAHELAPVVADEIETRALLESHPLGHAGALIHECLAAIAEEAGYLIVVSDADRPAAERRGLVARAHARGAGHELRRGHAVERARGRDQRDRHRARGRPCGPGVRARALQRGGPALDVLGGADPRSRHRRASGRDRPDRGLLDRPPPQPRGGGGDGQGGRGVPVPAHAGARRPPARPLRQSHRRGSRRPGARGPHRARAHRASARVGRGRPARDPARRRPADAPLGAAAVAEPVGTSARSTSCARCRAGSPAMSGRCSSWPSSAAGAPRWRRPTAASSCARGSARSSPCCARRPRA